MALTVEFLRWFLAQSSEDYHVPALDDCSPSPDAAAEERETTVRRVNTDVQATKDGFAAFQAWVHGVVDKDSRVMLGSTSNPRGLQEIIVAEWSEVSGSSAWGMEMESSSSVLMTPPSRRTVRAPWRRRHRRPR